MHVPEGGGLDRLFRPRSIAVIGASADAGKAGGAMMAALDGFPGPLYPVNPRAGEIAGRRAFVAVGDIPVAPDLAVLVTPAGSVPDLVDELAACGVGGVVICAGGFAESGAEGATLQARVAEVARGHAIRVLGPNTSGFVNPGLGVCANFMPSVRELRSGSIGVIAQSGGVNLMVSFLAHSAGQGVSLAVGLGNAVDVGFADALLHLADDGQTKAIALHIEGVADGRALIDAIAAVTERKPVAALKVGRADVGDFARSHTGALTGDWRLTRAALQQAGAVVVDTPTQLVDAVTALSHTRLPPAADPGVCLLTGQAGPGLLMADRLRSAGVSVPPLSPQSVAAIGELLPPLTYQANPVDTGRPDGTFGHIARIASDDPAIDTLLIYALEEAPTQGIIDALVAARPAGALGPTTFATGGLDADAERHRLALEPVGVPMFIAPDRAADAVAALAADARARHRRLATSSDGGAGATTPPRVPERLPLDEIEAKAIVAQLGVAVPAGRRCATRHAAHAALAELTAPVVVKVLDATIMHKSDHGAVHVDVVTPEQLDAALDAIDAALPDAAGYLVEERAASGTELLIGAVRDPVFGPTVALALGGVDVELAPPPALLLAPLSAADARAAIAALPVAVIAGHRGRPRVPVDALADLLVALGALLVDNPHVAEVEVNPLRAIADGELVALDALVA
jgi:acetyltransferase